jgi:hypothetical protein
MLPQRAKSFQMVDVIDVKEHVGQVGAINRFHRPEITHKSPSLGLLLFLRSSASVALFRRRKKTFRLNEDKNKMASLIDDVFPFGRCNRLGGRDKYCDLTTLMRRTCGSGRRSQTVSSSFREIIRRQG